MVKWLPNSEDTPPVWSMLPISVPLFPAFMESQPWVMENRGCILKQQQAGEAQSATAELARRVYRDEYRLSKRSLNDLLSIEQDVFQADSATITARYDAWDAAVRYAGAADNLLDMLGIERSRTVGDDLPAL